MMDIQKLRRFLSNDFNNAILSIRKKDDKIIPHLTLREKSKLNGTYIDVFGVDIKSLRKKDLELCDYMLENFLSNHTVIGINHFTRNQYHPDKVCFDIITTDGTFTIAVDKINIKEIFPNFIKRLESAKREGIIKSISKNNKLGTQLFLVLNENDINTGIGYYYYKILSSNKNGKIVIPNYEKKFVIRLIQEYLRIYQVTDNCCFESELLKLKRFVDEIKEKRGFYSLEFREYSINNLRFEFYKDERAIIQLELIIAAIEGMEKEFKYHTFSEVVTIPYKQLVIENYHRYGGRK